MELVSRAPGPLLRQAGVRWLWHYRHSVGGGRERVLPSGVMQLLVNLRSERLHWYPDLGSSSRRSLSGVVVQGMHAAPFGLDVADQREVAGVVFEPGAARPFLGLPLHALAHQHVDLEDVWGASEAARLRSDIVGVSAAGRRLARLEAALLRRLRSVDRKRDGAMEYALTRMKCGDGRVLGLADAVGLSERGFRARFRAEVGLSPKAMVRVLRFQRSIGRLRAGERQAEVAAGCGYHDQAHFAHEFRALSGLSPGAYFVRQPHHPNHVP